MQFHMASSADKNQGKKSDEPPTVAEDRQVGGHGQVAGHADLLPAGHAHAVHPADDRLAALQDGVHHGVEQVHVLAVLVGAVGVVLGVLLGVPAGAEGLVARPGEHGGHLAAIPRGRAEPGDHPLDHVGGVGVELLRVVQPDPGGVQPLDLLALRIQKRPFFENHTGGFRPPVLAFEQNMVLDLVVPGYPIKAHDRSSFLRY
jgi:hypothetical protein